MISPLTIAFSALGLIFVAPPISNKLGITNLGYKYGEWLNKYNKFENWESDIKQGGSFTSFIGFDNYRKYQFISKMAANDPMFEAVLNKLIINEYKTYNTSTSSKIFYGLGIATKGFWTGVEYWGDALTSFGNTINRHDKFATGNRVKFLESIKEKIMKLFESSPSSSEETISFDLINPSEETTLPEENISDTIVENPILDCGTDSLIDEVILIDPINEFVEA